MNTEEVLGDIYAERKYQRRIGNVTRSLAEDLILIQGFLTESITHYPVATSSVGDGNMDMVMNNLRKIAASCVRQMEVYGTSQKTNRPARQEINYE